MQKPELIIGQILRAGLFLSIFVVLIGGIIYLFQNGNQIIHYQTFHAEPLALESVLAIWRDAFSFSATGIIQLGLLILIVTQIVRVALTAWIFILQRDFIFIGISLFIFVILIYSIFWRG